MFILNVTLNTLDLVFNNAEIFRQIIYALLL